MKLISFFTLASLSLYATWEVTVGALYLRPQFDDPYFALQVPVTNVASGSRVANRFGNDGGYFAALKKYFPCNRSLALSSNYFEAGHTASVSAGANNNLFATKGAPSMFANTVSSAVSNIKLGYIDASLLFSQGLQPCTWLRSDFLIGLKLARFDFHEHDAYTNLAGAMQYTVDYYSQAIGGGLAFGLAATADLYRECDYALDLIANTQLAPLFGTMRAASFSLNSTTGASSVTAINTPQLRLLPLWETNLLLSYKLRSTCSCITLDVGYKLLYLSRYFDRINFYGPTANGAGSGVSSDDYGDVLLQGPFATLGYIF